MGIAVVQDKGLVKVTVSTSVANPIYLLYTGSDTPATVTKDGDDYKVNGNDAIEKKPVGNSGNQIFYHFFTATTPLFVVIARYDEDTGTYTIEEKTESEVTVDVPNYSAGVSLDGESVIGFDFTNKDSNNRPIVENKGIGFSLSNIAASDSEIAGLSYVIDVVKVVSDSEESFSTVSDFTAFKNLNVKYAVVKSLPLSDETVTTFYDSSLQYKTTKYYTYIAFLSLVLGNQKYGGWKVHVLSSLVNKGSDVTKRDTDDLYIENKVERIVAAQNRMGSQNIATKKFPKIGDGGSYFYSILVCSDVGSGFIEDGEIDGDRVANDLTDRLAAELKSRDIIAYTGTDDSNKDANGFYSYQLSGIGVVPAEFYRYQPVVNGTLKLSLSDK